MSDAETTVLYILSTLAQTCAALAAFVGAVGLYRLQNLATQRSVAERDYRFLASSFTGTDPVLTPINDLSKGLDRALAATTSGHGRTTVEEAAKARERWRAFVPEVQLSRWALVGFEGWNLLVIAASLVGFNHVPALASCQWTSWAVWAAAMGTVTATAWSVYVWTKESERPATTEPISVAARPEPLK